MKHSMTKKRLTLLALSFQFTSVFFVCTATAQTLLSQYKFDGNLLNSSTFVDTLGNPAPDGTYRVGTDSSSATAGTATFTTGVDGTANGAILFDGTIGWVDVTTAGHPSASVALTGTPTDDDPQASAGPGLVSGTALAWVKSTNTTGARWIMGNLNANPAPPFVFDTQAWLMGWDGSKLQTFARASGPGSAGVSRFTVSDPTSSTAWADGDWHHIAFRWNGAAEQGSGVPDYAAVFLDGMNLGVLATNYFLDPTDPQNAWQFPMAIGARNNRGTLDGFFDGAIDDLRIYSDSLTDQQIIDIYNELAPTMADGDFDGDGDVDGRDFLAWQRGESPSPFSSIDLADWQSAYNGGALAALKSVPEPATIFVLMSSLALAITIKR